MARVVKLAQQVADQRGLDADHRRFRNRQGSPGALRARPIEPRQEAADLRQLRGDPGNASGIRIVRPRKGRLHRRGGAPRRQVRRGQRRHAAARRDFRDRRAAAGETAARHSGTRHRPRRRHPAGADRYPHRRHVEPQSRGGGARRQLPRGSAVPAQRRELENPAAARTARRRDRARRIFRKEIRRGQRRGGTAAVGRIAAYADVTTTGPAMCASWKTPCIALC